MSNMTKQDYIKAFRSLANEERLDIILKLYKEGELCASDIEKSFFMEQSTTSHHLNYLKNVGLLDSRKQGRKVFFKWMLDNLKSLFKKFLTNFLDIKD